VKDNLINWNLKNTPPLEEIKIDQKIEYISQKNYSHISCSELKSFCDPECPKLNKKTNIKIDKKSISFLKTENEIIESVFCDQKGSLFAIYNISDQSIT